MFKNILNALAYQRYATQTLHSALIQKNKAVRQAFDPERCEMCDMNIMNIVHDIQATKNELESLVNDVPLQDRIAGMNDAESAIITDILADIARQEAFCRQELAELKIQSAAFCFTGIDSRPAASATLQ